MENPIIRCIKTKTEGLSGRLKFPLILLAIVIVAITAYLVWANFLSPEMRKQKEQERKMEQFLEGMAQIEERYKQDTYGGTTPQETIDMFITALENNDLESASKYFSLNSNGDTDPKWLEMLQEAKNEGRMNQAIELIKSAEYSGESVIGTAGFDVLGEDGTVWYSIDLIKNDFSNLWKIESI